ncbi:MAG: DUF11 domain-containing protein, partial [Thermoflexia bacterium]
MPLRRRFSLSLCLGLFLLAVVLLALPSDPSCAFTTPTTDEPFLQERLLRPIVSPGATGIRPAQSPAPGDVVIHEVAWGGTAANATHEWIELYNHTAADIDLTGWRLFSSDGKPDITLTGVISAFGYYLIERGTDSAISDIQADLVVSFGSSTGAGLSNEGEILTLTTPSGAVIDTANGNGGAWPAGSGSPDYRTMERVDPAAPDTDANWASNNGLIRNGRDANNNPINGTPKARNSASHADLVVEKSGPATVRPGGWVTYTLRARNAYSLTATAVLITDALPADLAFLAQTSPYTFTQPDPATLVWELGDLPPAAT